MDYQLSQEAGLWIKNFVDEVFNLPVAIEPCFTYPTRKMSLYHLSPGDCGEQPGQKCYEVVRTKSAQEVLSISTNDHFKHNRNHSFVVCETRPTGRMHLCFRLSGDSDEEDRHIDMFDKIVPSHLRGEIRKMGKSEGLYIEVSNLSTVRPLSVVL